MKLLVVEDESAAAKFLSKGLRDEGYAVDVARTGPAAEEAVAINTYNAIILDVMLPGINGFKLCRKWRDEGIETPILFLTARDDLTDKVRGLDIGGDDYLTKPFEFEELLARLRVLVRRSMRSGTGKPELVIGDLRLEPSSRRCFVEDREVVLTTREFQLLEYLARNRGTVVSRIELWEQVWETGEEPDSNVIDVYIRYLRDKLGRTPDYIRTVRGAGYMMDSE